MNRSIVFYFDTSDMIHMNLVVTIWICQYWHVNINRPNIHIPTLQNMVLSNIRWRKSNPQPGSISALSTFYVVCVLSEEISQEVICYICVCETEFVSWDQRRT